MAEEGTKVDRLVWIDIAERFEALQDELDLLKVEIKQTLVDLREFMMKERTLFPQASSGVRPPSTPSAQQDEYALDGQQATTAGPSAADGLGRVGIQTNEFRSRTPNTEALDTHMLGNVISWLGTVKDRGLALHQITPYLEAYEKTGYLTPVMVRVVLRSMADLDQLFETPSEREFSPKEYSQCLRELHDIICKPDTQPAQPGPSPATQQRGATKTPAGANGKANPSSRRGRDHGERKADHSQPSGNGRKSHTGRR